MGTETLLQVMASRPHHVDIAVGYGLQFGCNDV